MWRWLLGVDNENKGNNYWNVVQNAMMSYAKLTFSYPPEKEAELRQKYMNKSYKDFPKETIVRLPTDDLSYLEQNYRSGYAPLLMMGTLTAGYFTLLPYLGMRYGMRSHVILRIKHLTKANLFKYSLMVSITGLLIYGGLLYGIMRFYHVSEYSEIENNAREELMSRLAKRDPECMNELLGGALRLYNFTPDEIDKLMKTANERLPREPELNEGRVGEVVSAVPLSSAI